MRKKKVLIIGNTADEVAEALLKLGEAAVKTNLSMKNVLIAQMEYEYQPTKNKFGKGDRRKNKKQFMNQINMKR